MSQFVLRIENEKKKRKLSVKKSLKLSLQTKDGGRRRESAHNNVLTIGYCEA